MALNRKRRYYSFTLSLTIEQIEWLQKQSPSASSYVRKLIDKDINRRKELDVEKSEKHLEELYEKVRALGDLAQLRGEQGEEKLQMQYAAEMRMVWKEIERLQEKINKTKRSR